MATGVDFTPTSLNFGAVAPGSSGPDVSVDPSLGPPAISFSGSIRVKNVPVAANVTAAVKSGAPVFKIRDVIALEWVMEEVDPGELPPGHHGRPPKVRVLEVAAQSDGLTPLAVSAGQYLVVRIEYLAPSEGSNFTGALTVTGDTWEPIEVPLSLYLSGLSTKVAQKSVELMQGATNDLAIEIRTIAGPSSTVRFEISPTQLHSGVSIAGPNEFLATDVAQDIVLRLRAAIDAPVGDNTLAINQFFNNSRSGFFVPITIKPFLGIEKISKLTIVPEPAALTFNFTTVDPSRPVITIWERIVGNDPAKDMVSSHQLAVALGGAVPGTIHSIRVAGLPVELPLWFRIDAASEVAGMGAVGSRIGETATLRRYCFVRVLKIEVLQAGGDDGGPEDGNEIDFGFVVFDDETREQLSTVTGGKFDSVDHGETLHPSFGDKNGDTWVPKAPDSIVPYIKGVTFDQDLDPSIGPYWAMPDKLPDHLDSGADGTYSWADTFLPFSPPVTVGDFLSGTMVLSTGVTLLSYLTYLRIRTVITDPYDALKIPYPDLP